MGRVEKGGTKNITGSGKEMVMVKSENEEHRNEREIKQ